MVIEGGRGLLMDVYVATKRRVRGSSVGVVCHGGEGGGRGGGEGVGEGVGRREEGEGEG